MFHRASWIATLMLLAAAGCEGTTGLLIEIDRADVPGLAEVDELEIIVGTDRGDGRNVYLPDPGERTVSLGAPRDLLSNPYRILLEVGDFGDRSLDTTKVMVAVIGLSEGQRVGAGALASPVQFVSGEVRKYGVTLGSGISVDGDRDACLNILIGDTTFQIGFDGDKDCDGDLAEDDCNDLDPTIGPSRTEVCGNDDDDDCDQSFDEETDDDLDGVTNCQGDCDDQNLRVFPDAFEDCDGIDNNCNGNCDEGFTDEDGDGFLAECASRVEDEGTCAFIQPQVADCDDANPAVHGLAQEVCDGVDNDCDHYCDGSLVGFAFVPVADLDDLDGDGFGQCIEPGGGGSHVRPGLGSTCDEQGADCEPADSSVYPGAKEYCDGQDNDCGGSNTASTSSCIVLAMNTCTLGNRTCAGNEDAVNPCNSVGLPVAAPLCEVIEQCNQAGSLNPLCLADEATTERVACTADFVMEDSGGISPCAGAVTRVPTFGASGDCNWAVIALQGDYGSELQDQNGNGVGPTHDECSAKLRVSGSDGAVAAGTVYLSAIISDAMGVSEKVYALDIAPVLVDECQQRSLSCEMPFLPDTL